MRRVRILRKNCIEWRLLCVSTGRDPHSIHNPVIECANCEEGSIAKNIQFGSKGVSERGRAK